MLSDLIRNTYSAAAYSLVGVALMAVSFAVTDVLTPGNLRRQLWADRSRNAGIYVGSNLAAIGIIIVAAIVASEGDLAHGLLRTIVYAVIGIIVMALSFLLVDLLTPGTLGELVVHPEPHPAMWVHAVNHVAVAFIIAASIL